MALSWSMWAALILYILYSEDIDQHGLNNPHFLPDQHHSHLRLYEQRAFLVKVDQVLQMLALLQAVQQTQVGGPIKLQFCCYGHGMSNYHCPIRCIWEITNEYSVKVSVFMNLCWFFNNIQIKIWTRCNNHFRRDMRGYPTNYFCRSVQYSFVQS